MNAETAQLINHITDNTNEVVHTPKSLRKFADEAGVSYSAVSSLIRTGSKVGRGKYDLSLHLASDRSEEVSKPMSSTQSISNDDVYVPSTDAHFVRWGNSKDVEMIIKSTAFYPTFITGLSGNGKTMMVEQACAKNNRQYVRVQITPETDEDDLIGGFRLIDGETVFAKGPVIKAMESGAILLIDEIDRGSNKIMCLQGVLEGKPVMIKKTGQVIEPAAGFNVIATANTKGQGSEDGRYVAATIIDEAFLERFIITMEQPYPSLSVERKIVQKHMEKYDCTDTNFAEMLVTWADTIRKTFADGGVDETISTRRLCHIVQTFSIFSDRHKAIKLCLNRFDDDTKEAFLDLYEKVDASIGDPTSPASDNPGDESGITLRDALDTALSNDPFANSPDLHNGKPSSTNIDWNGKPSSSEGLNWNKNQ